MTMTADGARFVAALEEDRGPDRRALAARIGAAAPWMTAPMLGLGLLALLDVQPAAQAAAAVLGLLAGVGFRRAWGCRVADLRQIAEVCRRRRLRPLALRRDWTPVNAHWRHPRQYRLVVEQEDGRLCRLGVAMPLLGGAPSWICLSDHSLAPAGMFR
ncbi:MAG TPA: hypothetical protein PKA17_02870 [Phenylobacterium sp.]|nr:hypothetical protein [Phenylobacterium sp.]